MRKPPTVIADYSRMSPWDNKKLDNKFYRFPGDDKPVKTGADMFPAGVVRTPDTFQRKPVGTLYAPPDIKVKAEPGAAPQAPEPKAPSRKRRLLQCFLS